MMVPPRCFTCGALVGDKYPDFSRRVKQGEDPGEVMDSLRVKKYCCRRTLMSSTDLIDQVIPYYEALARRHEEFES